MDINKKFVNEMVTLIKNKSNTIIDRYKTVMDIDIEEDNDTIILNLVNRFMPGSNNVLADYGINTIDKFLSDMGYEGIAEFIYHQMLNDICSNAKICANCNGKTKIPDSDEVVCTDMDYHTPFPYTKACSNFVR